jgi:hypothetical protein
MEARAKQAGKANLRFHFFADLDHALGIGTYMSRGGTMPAGHRAIFDCIFEQAR